MSGQGTASRRALGRGTVAAAVLVVAFAVSYGALVWLDSRGAGAAARMVTASASAVVARLFGEPATVIGTRLYFPTRIIHVAQNCLPLETYAAALALACVAPLSYGRRALLAVAGVVAVSAVNVVRIAVLGVVSQQAPASFAAVHAWVFPLVLPIALFATWFAFSRDASNAA